MELSLSQELRTYADRLEKDYYTFLPEDERDEQIETVEFLGKLTTIIVSCRESLMTNQFAQLDAIVRDHRRVVERCLDQHYTLRQLDQVPDLVNRTLRLAHLNARDTPSKQTNRYLSEASRAYILGLPVAAVAMSRSALEQGMKERLGRQHKRDHIGFEALADEAGQQQILSATAVNASKDLARRCNRVLHQQPVKDEESAFEVLTAVRSMLEEIFSGTPA